MLDVPQKASGGAHQAPVLECLDELEHAGRTHFKAGGQPRLRSAVILSHQLEDFATAPKIDYSFCRDCKSSVRPMARPRISASVASAASVRLRINVLGKFAMSHGEVSLQPIGRKAQCMLSYLLLTDAPEAPRELLWSETDEKKARGSLRHSILEAQTALRAAGLGALKADKLHLAVNRSQI